LDRQELTGQLLSQNKNGEGDQRAGSVQVSTHRCAVRTMRCVSRGHPLGGLRGRVNSEWSALFTEAAVPRLGWAFPSRASGRAVIVASSWRRRRRSPHCALPRLVSSAVPVAGLLHLHRWLPGIGLHLPPVGAYPRVPQAVGLRVVVEMKLVAVQQRAQPGVLRRVTPRARHASRHGSHAG
jgi:hypothetical protein